MNGPEEWPVIAVGARATRARAAGARARQRVQLLAEGRLRVTDAAANDLRAGPLLLWRWPWWSRGGCPPVVVLVVMSAAVAMAARLSRHAWMIWTTTAISVSSSRGSCWRSCLRTYSRSCAPISSASQTTNCRRRARFMIVAAALIVTAISPVHLGDFSCSSRRILAGVDAARVVRYHEDDPRGYSHEWFRQRDLHGQLVGQTVQDGPIGRDTGRIIRRNERNNLLR